jgi:hypothetical protein
MARKSPWIVPTLDPLPTLAFDNLDFYDPSDEPPTEYTYAVARDRMLRTTRMEDPPGTCQTMWRNSA